MLLPSSLWINNLRFRGVESAITRWQENCIVGFKKTKIKRVNCTSIGTNVRLPTRQSLTRMIYWLHLYACIDRALSASFLCLPICMPIELFAIGLIVCSQFWMDLWLCSYRIDRIDTGKVFLICLIDMLNLVRFWIELVHISSAQTLIVRISSIYLIYLTEDKMFCI